MNFGAIYSGAVSLTPEDREKAGLPPKPLETNPISPAEQAAVVQGKVDWLQSPVTAELLKDLGSQVDESITEAIKLAVGYSSHGNPIRIIQLLNKAYELRQIIRKYGRTNQSTR